MIHCCDYLWLWSASNYVFMTPWYHTCLLVPLATSIIPMKSCKPFIILDFAFMRVHMAVNAFISSTARSSLPSRAFHLTSPNWLKRWRRSGANCLISAIMPSMKKCWNLSKVSGPCKRRQLDKNRRYTCCSRVAPSCTNCRFSNSSSATRALSPVFSVCSWIWLTAVDVWTTELGGGTRDGVRSRLRCRSRIPFT